VNLQATISYNSLSINTATRSAGGGPTAGYRVMRFAPDPPPPVSYLEKRALADGLDAGDVFLGGRSFGLIVAAYGSTEGDFWDKAQGLFSAFSPTIAYDADTANRGFLAFDFYQPTANIATWPASAYPDGIPMRYYMRPSSGPVYVLERDKDNPDGKAHSKQFSIPLVARDPRKYFQSATTTPQWTVSNQLVTYRGDYWTHPIVTFSLSAGGHSAFALRHDIGAYFAVINLSTESSGTFILDHSKGTLTKSGVSKAGLVSSANYGVVESGEFFRYENPTGISSCTMTYREAWA